jgi:ElaA protein
MNLHWQWYRMEALSVRQLYAVCAARSAVFVVEQHCDYQDLDGLDAEALHLVAWSDNEVAAYLRLLPPGARFNEPSIGRVLVARALRGKGLGRETMSLALKRAAQLYPEQPLRISAQHYLEAFYNSFGFVSASAPYMDEGTPHIEMLRAATQSER